jgi:oligosaccharyltransferase complex subunit gamma
VFTPQSSSQELQFSRPVRQPLTMRWIQLLTASLLPFTALAAKKTTGNRFDDFRSKSQSGSLKVNDISYAQLTKAPRDYAVAVLLTAMDARFQCQLCREFQPEWDLLAKSWVKGDKKGDSRLLFGTLDFADGKDTFQSVWHMDTYNEEHES